MTPSQKIVPTFSWVFEKQLIVSGILTEPSSRKQFASRRKRPWKTRAGHYQYIQIFYRSVF